MPTAQVWKRSLSFISKSKFASSPHIVGEVPARAEGESLSFIAVLKFISKVEVLAFNLDYCFQLIIIPPPPLRGTSPINGVRTQFVDTSPVSKRENPLKITPKSSFFQKKSLFFVFSILRLYLELSHFILMV